VTEPRGIGDAIASQVRKYRLLRNWSVRQLAEECERLGAPQLTAPSLANIERGQVESARRTGRRVLVEELVVLARALQVPPALLVFPLGGTDTIEVTPGEQVLTWEALKWFTGEAPFPHWQERDEDGFVVAEVGELADREAWEQGAAPVELYRSYERYLLEWQISRRRAASYRRTAELSEEGRTAKLTEASAEDRTAQSLEGTIWEQRRRMRQLGLTPPDLPENLSHLDTDQTPLQRAFGADLIRRGSGRTLPSEDE
jgi:transcriptional regulator with XRE-family HTH domain